MKADSNGKTYSCSICGLHYMDSTTAEKCYNWCREHNSCNLEITSKSLERLDYQKSR